MLDALLQLLRRSPIRDPGWCTLDGRDRAFSRSWRLTDAHRDSPFTVVPIPTQATAAPSPASSNSEGARPRPPRVPVRSSPSTPSPVRAPTASFDWPPRSARTSGWRSSFWRSSPRWSLGLAPRSSGTGADPGGGGILVLLVVVAFVRRAPAIVRGAPDAWRDFGAAARAVIRNWAPFTIVMWAFESMETYTGVIRKMGITRRLPDGPAPLRRRADRLGGPPLSSPADRLDVAHLRSLFILPMIVASALSLRGRRHDLPEL